MIDIYAAVYYRDYFLKRYFSVIAMALTFSIPRLLAAFPTRTNSFLAQSDVSSVLRESEMYRKIFSHRRPNNQNNVFPFKKINPKVFKVFVHMFSSE